MLWHKIATFNLEFLIAGARFDTPGLYTPHWSASTPGDAGSCNAGKYEQADHQALRHNRDTLALPPPPLLLAQGHPA